MRLIPAIAVACTLAGAAVSYAPTTEAARIVVGIGLPVPGFAIAAPAPYYYGPTYPAFYAAPFIGYRPYLRGYYGRPYFGHRGWR